MCQCSHLQGREVTGWGSGLEGMVVGWEMERGLGLVGMGTRQGREKGTAEATEAAQSRETWQQEGLVSNCGRASPG